MRPRLLDPTMTPDALHKRPRCPGAGGRRRPSRPRRRDRADAARHPGPARGAPDRTLLASARHHPQPALDGDRPGVGAGSGRPRTQRRRRLADAHVRDARRRRCRLRPSGRLPERGTEPHGQPDGTRLRGAGRARAAAARACARGTVCPRRARDRADRLRRRGGRRPCPSARRADWCVTHGRCPLRGGGRRRSERRAPVARDSHGRPGRPDGGLHDAVPRAALGRGRRAAPRHLLRGPRGGAWVLRARRPVGSLAVRPVRQRSRRAGRAPGREARPARRGRARPAGASRPVQALLGRGAARRPLAQRRCLPGRRCRAPRHAARRYGPEPRAARRPRPRLEARVGAPRLGRGGAAGLIRGGAPARRRVHRDTVGRPRRIDPAGGAGGARTSGPESARRSTCSSPG
jgi:hypothetical protein